MNGMVAIVLAPTRCAESEALVSALGAGLGSARVFRLHTQALRACQTSPRAVLLLDLRAADETQRAQAASLRRACPTVPTAALVQPGAGAPADCDSVFTAPVFLEDVVRWCARASQAPVADGILADLAAGLSHEIGNPLTSLFLQLELLRADDNGGFSSEHLELIEESARRIESVVRDVADAAQRQSVQARKTTLRELMDAARAHLVRREPGLDGRVTTRGGDVTAEVDVELLSTALAELWEYLLKAGEDTDRLRVEARTSQRDGYVIEHRARTPRLPEDAYCMIAVTWSDLYPDDTYNFVFGLARLTARVGVFSFARLHPDFYGIVVADPIEVRHMVMRRSLAVMSHEIGHMFGLGHCVFHSCNLNGSNSLEESDRQPMHLCPVCLRKLHVMLGFDPAQRYGELREQYRRAGLEQEEAWARRRQEFIEEAGPRAPFPRGPS